jgi:hypothetical protein
MLGENGGNQQEEEGASKKRGKLLIYVECETRPETKDEKTDNLKFVLSTTLLSLNCHFSENGAKF